MSKNKELSFDILGKAWTIRLLKRKKYVRKNGKESIAVTYRAKRRIDLSPRGRDYETIVHELVHGYMTELCLDSAELSAHDIEEIFCELMAKHGLILLSTAENLREQIDEIEQNELTAVSDNSNI